MSGKGDNHSGIIGSRSKAKLMGNVSCVEDDEEQKKEKEETKMGEDGS
jgi:hypothetical protein